MKVQLCIATLVLLVSCSSKQETRNGRPEGIIYIDVFEKGYFTINGNRVATEELEETISTEVDEIEKLGFARDEIIANIVTAPGITMGQIVDVQIVLRDLQIRKVFYGDPDEATEQAVPGRSL